VPKDPVQAAALYKLGCDGDNARACAGLGLMYASGTGVTKDTDKAAALFKKGCDGGNPDACAALNAKP